MFKVTTSDKKEFQISKKVCEISDFFKEISEDFGAIPLNNIDSKIFEKILEFCNYYTETEKMNEIPRPVNSEKIDVQEWYVEYINIPEDDITKLLDAANFLGINDLIYLCCAKLAFNIKNSTKEELINKFFKNEKDKFLNKEQVINKYFNITDTLTEEEQEILKNNEQWIEPIY